jgi:hypothetical protein
MTDSERRFPAHDRVAVAALVAVVFILFAPALHPGRIFYERDIADYWYPQVEAFVRAVAEGSWPLWNPYFSFGLPMWEDPAYQITYPPTWLNLIFGPATYYKIFVLSHCCFTGVGLYRLARRLRLASVSAFTAAVVWTLSGPFLSTVNLFHHFAGATWIPWVLLALHRALRTRTVGAALTLGAVAALQVLAGSGDMVVVTGLLSCGLAALHLWNDGTRGAAVATVRTIAVAAPFAAVLSAVLWLPTASFAREGTRLTQPATHLYWSLHPATLVDMMVPRFCAEVLWSAPVRGRLFEGREPFLASFYLGMVALALAALARVGPGSLAKRAVAAAFLFFVVLACGKFLPLVPLLLGLPPFSVFRYPMKYLLGASVAMALLVGFGMEAWLSEWDARKRRSAALLSLLLFIFAAGALGVAYEVHAGAFRFLFDPRKIAGSEEIAFARLLIAAGTAAATAALVLVRRATLRPPIALTAVLGALLIGDLLWAGRRINPVAPVELLHSRPLVLQGLGPKLDHVRVWVQYRMTLDAIGREVQPDGRGWPFEWQFLRGYQDMMPPPIAARWRLDGSFDGNFTGLTPRSIDRMSWMASATEDSRLVRRMLQIGAVDDVIVLKEPIAQGLELVGLYPSVYSNPIRLYRVPDALPRAYMVGRARALDSEETFRLIASADFDPRSEVLLEPGTQPLPMAAPFSGGASIVERRSDRLVIDTDSSAEGYVVVVETYMPGWQATVDGGRADILRANAAFRAVRVPAGRHRVEMRYRPRGVVYGCALAAAGVLFGLGFWEGRRRRSLGRTA